MAVASFAYGRWMAGENMDGKCLPFNPGSPTSLHLSEPQLALLPTRDTWSTFFFWGPSFEGFSEFILVKHLENSAWHIVSAILCLLNKDLGSWSWSEKQNKYCVEEEVAVFSRAEKKVYVVHNHQGFSILRQKKLFSFAVNFWLEVPEWWRVREIVEGKANILYEGQVQGPAEIPVLLLALSAHQRALS